MPFAAYIGGNYASFTEAAVEAGIIVSIQQIPITILGADTVGTAVIPTSVVESRTAIFYTGVFGGKSQTSTIAGNDHVHATVETTSPTELTATRGLANASVELLVMATVVEFTAAAVDSVQQFTFTYSGLSATDTQITSVDTARSVALLCGTRSNNTGFANGSAMADIDLTNATTVTSTRGTNPGTNDITVAYNVIEFAVGIVDSVQKFNISITSAVATTADAIISSVDLTRSCIFPGGFATNQTTTNMSSETCHGRLFSDSAVRAERQVVGSAQPRVAGTVVEFAPGIIQSVQRNIVTHAGGSLTQDTAVTSITPSLSVVVANGAGSSATQTADPEEQHFRFEIIDATTIRSTKGQGGRNIIYPFELVEYAA